jgi:hypothetical protein
LGKQGTMGARLLRKMKYSSEDMSFYKAIHEMMRRVRSDVMTAARTSRRRETPSRGRRSAVVAA